MATKNRTAIRAAESESDDVFRELMHRFVLATERLTLAFHALARCEDYGPATCVVEEATEARKDPPRSRRLGHETEAHREGGAIMSKVTARTEASPDEEAQAEGGAIMSNASTEASSDEEDDSFTPLMQRLASAIHRLKLAADNLSDLAETMPAGEHGSAAFVVAETTEYLNQLYRSLEAWEATHKYTPRDMRPLMEHLRQIDADDDAVDRMLHGRTVLSPSASPVF